MALIGEMQYLTIGGSTYSIPTGTTVEVERNLTSGTKSATIKVDGTSYDLYAPTPNAGTVTSVRVQATSPVQSSTSTAQSSSLNTTISLANGYGDTKNPYGTKTKNYVLAGPTTGSDAAPTFRALVAADIPDLSSTYLTSYTETDPVYSASAASGITSSDISNWNSKTSNTGTITSVKTTAGTHTTINVSSGAANFNVPTATSHLTNDSGFITSFTDENVKNTAVTAATTYYLTGSTSSSTATGGLSKHAAIKAYVTANTSTGGSARIDLGNTTATTSAGGKEGIIRLYGTSATYYVELKAGAPSANRTISFPNKAGTVALTTDIPTVSYPVTSVNNKTGAVSLSASDVGALPSTTAIPSKTSDLTNDSGFLTSYTETDPTVPDWAKADSKPSYTAAEVGALPKTGGTITTNGLSIYGSLPSATQGAHVAIGNGTIRITSQTSSSYRSVTLAANNSGLYISSNGNAVKIQNLATPTSNTDAATKKYVDDSVNAISIPTKTSDLTNDSGYAVINNTTVTLTAAGWSNNSQSVTVTGVTTSNNVIVTAAAASESTYLNCGVKCSSQAANTLTFTCTTTPTDAIDVNVIVLTGN